MVKAGYKQTEVGVIPEDWKVPRIESILSEISMGPFGSDIKVSNFVSDGIPVLSGSNVRSVRLTDSFTNFVTPTKAKSLKKAVARRGDIVVTHRGTLGQISYIPEDSVFDQYVISQSQFRARFIENLVSPYWVALYFNTEQGSRQLLEGKGHTGVPAIAQPTTTFRQLYIPLPSLPEQRAIAEALSDVDALIAALDKLIAKKRAIKTAAMQDLLTGKKRLPGFEGEWKEKRIAELAEVDPENLTANTKPDYEFKYISLDDVDEGSLKNYSEKIFSSAPSRARRVLRKDDVLLSTVRPNLQSHLLFDKDEKDWICSTGFAVIRCLKQEADPAFVYFHLFGENISKQIEALISGSNYPAINSSDVGDLHLPVPEVEEQKAIKVILSDMDAEITALETRRDKTQALKQGMMQELLTGRTRLV